MRRSVTIRGKADEGVIEVREGEQVLGRLSAVERGADAQMSATYSPVASERAAHRDARRLSVWHTAHDMRLDEPGTLALTPSRATFQANAAYLMMRDGGLS